MVPARDLFTPVAPLAPAPLVHAGVGIVSVIRRLMGFAGGLVGIRPGDPLHVEAQLARFHVPPRTRPGGLGPGGGRHKESREDGARRENPKTGLHGIVLPAIEHPVQTTAGIRPGLPGSPMAKDIYPALVRVKRRFGMAANRRSFRISWQWSALEVVFP